MDPRPAGVEARIGGIRRILAVSGGKGGTGKSMVSSTLALLLADAGKRTGLLDLDLTGPSDHVILGVEPRLPDEAFGVDPLVHHGLRFMSVTCFSGDTPAPLRGPDVSNALVELLAVTRWGEPDFLVLDMPPGLGDVMLDLARLLREAEYLFVTTASRVALETVRKTLRLHAGLGTRVGGLVENMSRNGTAAARKLADDFGVAYLGALPFDETLEGALGDADALRRTPFAAALSTVRDAVLRDPDAP